MGKKKTRRVVLKKTVRRAPAAGARGARASLAVFHVDAFTRRVFHGNPAAVVVLDQARWPADENLQAIAAENNLSETAFVLRRSRTGPMAIRWMTPTVEVALCGHATLAAAHVLWNHLRVSAARLTFQSKSGKLGVSRDRKSGRLVLDFPALPGRPVPVTREMGAALGVAPIEAHLSSNLMCVFGNRREVHELTPDFGRIARLHTGGVIVTAPGSGHDFVSRFFAPNCGINEDPATGSSHCVLTPYWAHVLGKKSLTGHQISKRGGELFCELKGGRVLIGGHAVTYMTGRIVLG